LWVVWFGEERGEGFGEGSFCGGALVKGEFEECGA